MQNGGADFSQETYRLLLSETRRLYPCVGFDVLCDSNMTDKQFCIIRHDIDMSPETALQIAAIEYELGVRATYTVLLTGNFYNPFDARTRKIIREIADFGHAIGLHFDAAWHKINSETELHDAIAWERETLSRLLPGVSIEMFSFHNTTSFSMNCKASHYGELFNAYAGDLQDNVAYVSDSNGYWRFKTWEQMLAERPPRLQVLTHPEWWTAMETAPAEKVCWHLDQRSRRTWEEYTKLLIDHQRENRSNVPSAFARLSQGNAEEREILRLWLSDQHHTAYHLLLNLHQKQTSVPVSGELAAVDMTTPEHLLASYFEELSNLHQEWPQ